MPRTFIQWIASGFIDMIKEDWLFIRFFLVFILIFIIEIGLVYFISTMFNQWLVLLMIPLGILDILWTIYVLSEKI